MVIASTAPARPAMAELKVKAKTFIRAACTPANSAAREFPLIALQVLPNLECKIFEITKYEIKAINVAIQKNHLY